MPNRLPRSRADYETALVADVQIAAPQTPNDYSHA